MFVLGRVPCGGTALGFPTPWEPFCNVRLFFLSGVLPDSPFPEALLPTLPRGAFRVRFPVPASDCPSGVRFPTRLREAFRVRFPGPVPGRLRGAFSGSGSGCPAGLLRSRDRRFLRLSRGTSERLRQPLSGPFRTAAYIFVVANYLTKVENLCGKSKYCF